MDEPNPTYTISSTDRKIVFDLAQALANIRAMIGGRVMHTDPLEQLAADEQLIKMIAEEIS